MADWQNASLEQKTQAVAGCGCLVLVAAIVALSMFGGESQKREPSDNKLGIEAFVYSQEFVTRYLVSPGSAKFPFGSYTATRLPGNKWRISGYCDSQNAFGALLRTKYTTVMSKAENDSGWFCELVSINGDTVFSRPRPTAPPATAQQISNQQPKKKFRMAPPTPPPPSPAIDPTTLEVGARYTVSRNTLLVPDFEPSIKPTETLPSGGSFQIKEIRMKDGVPWYRVTTPASKSLYMWIDSSALLGPKAEKETKPVLHAIPVLRQPATAPAAAPATEPVQIQQPAGVNQLVYITGSGKKFHRANCRYVKPGASGIARSEAEARGFEPCKVCNPVTR